MSSKPSKWNGRMALILLLACFFVPAAIAWTLFFTGWTPTSTSNHGTLVEPPHRLDVELLDASGNNVSASALRGRWSMLVVNDGECDAACLERIAALQQVRIALAQNQDRARIVLILPEGANAPSGLATGGQDSVALYWAREPMLPDAAHDGLSTSLVDTRGYRMMRYDEPFQPYGMLQDMKKLLRLSNIDLERLQGLSEDA
ncbi:hypothetical protein J2T57_002354 [Natronocella acetinitrilica]|uniref:Transmembrane cytochrome oxidase associated protein n=1 Tax=Natronocella acetinitrilica TaxID=414046 RepID=A0AAE3G5Q0_9GAMM|nr:hypothetical protein [Natronocella acetinitrilica]MCP1675206.1 hypothetical protein [Natronocella acetinitrilica]